jgi:LmbE family N-acetylglucosaminyl deacetylase
MKSPEQTADEITESIFRLIEQGDHDRESRFRMVSAVVQSALSGNRKETLEEAARVADAEASRYPDYDRSSHQAAALNSATQIAQAIRSLSEDKEGG